MKTIFTVILFIITSSYYMYAEKSILFIGNSVIEPYYEFRLNELIKSSGKELRILNLSQGGYLLRKHLDFVITKKYIDSVDWTYVVLQESPGVLGLKPGSEELECDYYMHDAVDSLNKWIKENHYCTETVFYMPWSYVEGDTSYFPENDFIVQQEQIRNNVLRYSDEFNALTIPVGMAWHEVRKNKPWLELYRDIVHANHTGHFLNACIVYSFIFKESPVNIPNSSFVTEFVSDSTADYLKELAGHIVLDNPEKWNYYVNVPDAEFIYKQQDMTFEFYSEKDSPYLSHSWYFGDGDSSNQVSPVHTYDNVSDYTVTHIVRSECYPESRTDTIVFTGTDVKDIISNDDNINICPNPNDGRFRIEFGEETPNQIRIFDLLGQLVYSQIIKQNHEKSNMIIQLYQITNGSYIMQSIYNNKITNSLIHIY
ncbi:DUF4886 domain-containing protein [Bacteroidota bacterium]